MAEWFMAPVLKTDADKLPWVRILPYPKFIYENKSSTKIIRLYLVGW